MSPARSAIWIWAVKGVSADMTPRVPLALRVPAMGNRSVGAALLDSRHRADHQMDLVHQPLYPLLADVAVGVSGVDLERDVGHGAQRYRQPEVQQPVGGDTEDGDGRRGAEADQRRGQHRL